VYAVAFTILQLVFEDNNKQDKQCTANVTLRRVRVTTVAVEKQ